MVYVTKRSDLEIRLREQLIENTEQVTKYRYDMNKQELIKSKQERKILKQKINKFIKKNHELIMKPPIQYGMLRIKSSIS